MRKGTGQMIVRDLIAWLEKLPQSEEVKWESRRGGIIALMIHDIDDPYDDYESGPVYAK